MFAWVKKFEKKVEASAKRHKSVAWCLTIYKIIDKTVRSFLRARALEGSASIAFYAFFSLFPTLLFIIAILSFFLKPAEVNVEVFKLVKDFFPISQEDILPLIEGTINTVVDRRSSMSIIAVVGLLWSGSNVFTVVVRNLNRAWGSKSAPLHFIKARLIAIVIIAALAGFITLSLLINPIVELLANYEIGTVAMYQTSFWWAFTLSLPHFFSLLFFFALYYWVPATNVHWIEAAIGAVLSNFAWQTSIWGLTWLITEGVINYQLVYGSLTTIVLIMAWIYISNLILLFGAHLSVSVAQYRRHLPDLT